MVFEVRTLYCHHNKISSRGPHLLTASVPSGLQMGSAHSRLGNASSSFQWAWCVHFSHAVSCQSPTFPGRTESLPSWTLSSVELVLAVFLAWVALRNVQYVCKNGNHQRKKEMEPAKEVYGVMSKLSIMPRAKAV